MNLTEAITAVFTLPFLTQALVILLLISIPATLVGILINLNELEFLSDGLTHAVFPGLAIGFVISGANGTLVGAVIVAVLLTLLFSALTMRRVANEVATAIILTGSFSLGVIVVSARRDFGSAIEAILFGHLLTAQPGELTMIVILSAAVTLVIGLCWRAQIFVAFDADAAHIAGISVRLNTLLLHLAVALVVVLAATTIGTLLTLSILFCPTVATRLLSRRLPIMLVLSFTLSTVAAIAGLVLSYSTSVQAGLKLSVSGLVTLSLVGTFCLALFIHLLRKIFKGEWINNRKSTGTPGVNLKQPVKTQDQDEQYA